MTDGKYPINEFTIKTPVTSEFFKELKENQELIDSLIEVWKIEFSKKWESEIEKLISDFK